MLAGFAATIQMELSRTLRMALVRDKGLRQALGTAIMEAWADCQHGKL